MAQKKKYSQKALKEAVEKYFASITREVVITEKVDSGKKDAWGHTVYETREVINSLGEVAKRTEYLVAPTLEGLCLHLGIVGSTWNRWKDKKKYPEYQKILDHVYERLIAWRKEQVVIRDKVAGIVWDLETNYGCVKSSGGMPKVELVMEEKMDGYGV